MAKKHCRSKNITTSSCSSCSHDILVAFFIAVVALAVGKSAVVMKVLNVKRGEFEKKTITIIITKNIKITE